MNEVKLTYGDWFGPVLIDGKPLGPERSQAVWNHSPDGFSWGYGGSGPAQLALAILLHVTDDEEMSVRLHQAFKESYVSQWPQDSGGTFWVPVQEWFDDHASRVYESAHDEAL